MNFIQWLKSLFKREKEKMSDQSVAQPEAAQPAAAQPVAAESAQPADTGSLNSGSGAQVADTTSTSSPLEQAKAKFDAFVEFVEHGLEVLGEDAEADLVALKDKFL
ncbi:MULTISPECIES: hypothetical protein [unclassified Tatumella]|uniref:hypothetical protein n=1 Tax=unclassified Tatumella TaxID=2649542 RepID=UPI0020134F84|nr:MULTISPECIES: hypothetical protein [unclassified Tatumella]